MKKKMKVRSIDKISIEFAQIVRKKLKDRIKKIVLFGSHARGDFNEGSDYDMLVVVDKREKADKNMFLDLGVKFLNKYNVLVADILCDEKEWERKKRYPIGLNILKEGIEL